MQRLDFYVKLINMGFMPLPRFNQHGLLPPGEHGLTFGELRSSYLVTGEGESPSWDSEWRRRLVGNLETLVKQLWIIGIERIFVDGSFVEQKDHPNDIDGYFECERRYFISGKLQKDLNLLDPGIWTWSTESLSTSSNSAKRQLPMWFAYRVELYPHFGQSSGIKDQFGHELQFPSAFRQRRSDSKEKGIIQVFKEETHD